MINNIKHKKMSNKVSGPDPRAGGETWESGNAIIELALVLPLLLFLALAMAEFCLIYRASLDMRMVARVGAEASSYGPGFPVSAAPIFGSNGSLASQQNLLSQFDECYDDIWNPPSADCGHIATHVKMNRAFVQLSDKSLGIPTYTTKMGNDGIIRIDARAPYSPFMLIGNFLGFSDLQLGDIQLSGQTVARSFGP